MSDAFEDYERNGLTVEIYQDDNRDSPREWDNVGTMICSHTSYNLGDEQFDPEDYDGWDDLRKYLETERGAVILLPLYLYDHSGISMYTTGDNGYRQHESWDSGQVGIIYCTKEDIDREWGGDSKKAEEYLRYEVRTYDQYLVGDVWGFVVTNPKTGEEIDSCWGFYGIEEARREGSDAADYFKHPHDAAYAKHARELFR